MDFGAPTLVHAIKTKKEMKIAPIIGASWTTTRGQILITDAYSVRLCHRDHGNILRAWTFRPDKKEAFVGQGAKMVTEGRVRWIVGRRKNGTVVAWREDDETGTLNMNKFNNIFDAAENQSSDHDSQPIKLVMSADRAIEISRDDDNNISCTGWDTTYTVPLRTIYLPTKENELIKNVENKIISASISNDKKSILIVLESAVYVVAVALHESSLANVVGKKRSYNINNDDDDDNDISSSWESRGILVIPEWSKINTGKADTTIWDIESGSATVDSRVETKSISGILKQKSKKGFENALIEYIEEENRRKELKNIDGKDNGDKNNYNYNVDKLLLGDRFVQLVVNACLERKCWDGLLHLIITCSISARSVPMMIPSILKATKRSVGNSKNRKKKRKVTNAKESNSYVADSLFICHILDNVYDISETMLVAILQFTIRRLSDSESFHTVMKSLLRAPFNGLFMSRSLRELTNPEVKIVLLYLKRALKLEIVGGKKETNASSSNQNKKKKSRKKGLKGQDDNDTIIGTSISRDDQVLPRIVAWCSMVLDAHFNGVIMRSATTGGDLFNVMTSVKSLVDDYLESCKISEALQVQLTQFKKIVDGAKLPAAVVPEYTVEILMV